MMERVTFSYLSNY